MPQYFYRAKSLLGEEKTGFLQADNLQELAEILKEQGFILEKAEIFKKKKFFPFFKRVSLTEKLMFTRSLQVMVSAGFALPKALQVLAVQARNKKFQKVLLDIHQRLIRGQNFSDSLGCYPEIFSELFQNMIKVGEEAGNLDQVLGILTRQLEKEHELKSKIRSAFIYPAVIITIMVIIGILMLVLVVPQLSATFEELGIELPFTTRLVIGLGNFLVTKWYLAIAVFGILFVLFYLSLKTKSAKKAFNFLFLRIPIISSLIKKTNSARTTRTLSSLIEAGVPIVRSLEIVANVLDNLFYKEALLAASERIKKGEKLSSILNSYLSLFSPLVVEMMKVGEETGETGRILLRLAEFLEEEAAVTVKNLTAVIEPALILLVGVAIGFFAVSLIQPMYSMLETL